MIIFSKQALLKHLIPELFTPEIAQIAAAAYPQFAPLMDLWITQGCTEIISEHNYSLGEAPSVWNDFTEYLLDLISLHPAYGETVKALSPRFTGVDEDRDVSRLNDARLEPWVIADHAELKRLTSYIHDESRRPHYYPKTQHIYSAASVALHFANTCTEAIRTSFRKITLIENEVSVARSACHGRGFIPLCQENSKLHVERRVSLWKTIWPGSGPRRFDYIYLPDLGMGYNDLESDRLLA